MKGRFLKYKNFIKSHYKWILLFLAVIGFLEVAEEVLDEEIMKRDVIGYKIVSSLLISDFMTPIAKFITSFGGVIGIISMAILLFVVIRKKKIGMAIILNLVLSSSLNYTLKNILQRPRPNVYRIVDEKGYSFPSGHSMVSMAFYGFLIYLIFKNVRNRKIKWISIIGLSTLIFLIGLSRIYLGVHYVSDVMAGFFVAFSYLVLYTSIVKRYIYD